MYEAFRWRPYNGAPMIVNRLHRYLNLKTFHSEHEREGDFQIPRLRGGGTGRWREPREILVRTIKANAFSRKSLCLHSSGARHPGFVRLARAVIRGVRGEAIPSESASGGASRYRRRGYDYLIESKSFRSFVRYYDLEFPPRACEHAPVIQIPARFARFSSGVG